MNEQITFYDEVEEKPRKPMVRFLYDHKHRLRGALAWQGEKVGYSWCHPNDIQKCTKKLARRIALGRLEKCQIYPALFSESRNGEGWVRARGYRDTWVPREVGKYLDLYFRVQA